MKKFLSTMVFVGIFFSLTVFTVGCKDGFPGWPWWRDSEKPPAPSPAPPKKAG